MGSVLGLWVGAAIGGSLGGVVANPQFRDSTPEIRKRMWILGAIGTVLGAGIGYSLGPQVSADGQLTQGGGNAPSPTPPPQVMLNLPLVAPNAQIANGQTLVIVAPPGGTVTGLSINGKPQPSPVIVGGESAPIGNNAVIIAYNDGLGTLRMEPLALTVTS